LDYFLFLVNLFLTDYTQRSIEFCEDLTGIRRFDFDLQGIEPFFETLTISMFQPLISFYSPNHSPKISGRPYSLISALVEPQGIERSPIAH